MQLIVVPRLGWGPRRLLRARHDARAHIAPHVRLALAPTLWPVASFAMGVASGAASGYSAGASLLLPSASSGIAGVINATGAITRIIASTPPPCTAGCPVTQPPRAVPRHAVVFVRVLPCAGWTLCRAHD